MRGGNLPIPRQARAQVRAGERGPQRGAPAELHRGAHRQPRPRHRGGVVPPGARPAHRGQGPGGEGCGDF